MKESRISSKGIWWDGYYGGVCKNGKFVTLYRKPSLEFIGEFDAVTCFPDGGHDIK